MQKPTQETVLYRANPAMLRCSPARFVLVCFLCLFLVGIPVLLIWWLKCKSTELTVTNWKVALRQGILSKRLNEVRIEDIRNVQLRQGLLQRIFDVGWIGISSAGQSGLEIDVDGIPSPGHVKTIIDNARR